MALAKPTNLTVQGLRPAFALHQRVQRVNPAHRIPLEQWTGGAHPVRRLVIEQRVERVTPPRILGIRQRTGTRRNPAMSLSLRQVVVFLRHNPAQRLGLHQRVNRPNAALTLRLRQLVTAETQGQTPRPRFVITLDGEDISARCRYDITISASEGGNRTCRVILRAQPGPLNIPGFKGKALHIDRLQGGELVPRFRGWVDEPVYDRLKRTVTLAGSDLRGERLGREDRDRLRSLTGGLFSPVTQREDASGEAWVRELLRTVAGSLDYTSDGTLRYRPWTLASPRFSLAAGQVNADRVAVAFDTRSESVNTVKATLEYRYYQRHAIEHDVSVEVEHADQDVGGTTGQLPAHSVEDEDGNLVAQSHPTRQALYNAAHGVASWQVLSLDYIEFPKDGWYKFSASDTNPTHWRVSPEWRELRAMGAHVTLARYLSQPTREQYELTFSAPQSVDQYGEIAGSDLRHALETRIDPAIYEERGCTIVADADDRRADLEAAIEVLQRMAERTILEGHRRNTATFSYKPKTGRAGHRELLPVEIGDTLEVTSSEVSVTGWVSAFTDRQTEKGDIWTEIRLAMSRVDSELSVTEDWSLPAPPTRYTLSPPPPGQLATPDCPVPEGDEAAAQGESRIEPDGTVIITTPAIDRGRVDEITGKRIHSYDIAIPTDPISVEVPND